jgi:hypothetical protein
VELMRRGVDAANRRDVDAAASFYAPDAVYESAGMGASFQDAVVAEMRERKAVRVDYYSNRAEALKAMGLEE